MLTHIHTNHTQVSRTHTHTNHTQVHTLWMWAGSWFLCGTSPAHRAGEQCDHRRYLRSLRRRRRLPGPGGCGRSCPSGLSRLLPQPGTGPRPCDLSDKPSLTLTNPLCPEKKGRHLKEKSPITDHELLKTKPRCRCCEA